MRHRQYLATLVPLLFACGSGDVTDPLACGPNDECPTGSICRISDRKCVQSMTGPDAGLAPCMKPINRALSFAGRHVLTVPDSTSLRPLDLTLEAWARFSSAAPTFQVIVTKPLGNTTGDSYVIWYESGQINAGANPTNVADGIGRAFTPIAGQWYHFTFTFDHVTREQKLYVDGALVASGTTTAVVQYDDQPLLIGADLNFGALSGFFQGEIDEVKLWTSVRDLAQVGLDLHSCTPGNFTGLSGYWALDEGSGQTTADASGNGNDGVLGTAAGVDASDPAWTDSSVPF